MLLVSLLASHSLSFTCGFIMRDLCCRKEGGCIFTCIRYLFVFSNAKKQLLDFLSVFSDHGSFQWYYCLKLLCQYHYHQHNTFQSLMTTHQTIAIQWLSPTVITLLTHYTSYRCQDNILTRIFIDQLKAARINSFSQGGLNAKDF